MKKKSVFWVVALLVLGLSTLQAQDITEAGWPPDSILSRFDLETLTQPAGTVADEYEVYNSGTLIIRLEKTTEAHAAALVAQIQKLPDIKAAPFFNESLDEGATSGRFIFSYWEIEVSFSRNAESIRIYVKDLRETSQR